MTARPTDFMSVTTASRKALTLPSLTVTKSAKGSAKGKPRQRTVYGVDSLEKLVAAFDENERSLKSDLA
jgi:hypothetical protein